jgi:prolyl oligopeptidase PreP (S9A serine peptidase family)
MLSPKGDELLFESTSYTEPYVWSNSIAATKKIRRTALVGKSPADFSKVEVVREFATSKDGTKIPMNIMRRKKTKLDGSNPTLLYGYGGYGINMTPTFPPPAACGWSTAAFMWWPTCAAAASLGRNGTRPAASRTNKMSSTISPPARSMAH